MTITEMTPIRTRFMQCTPPTSYGHTPEGWDRIGPPLNALKNPLARSEASRAMAVTRSYLAARRASNETAAGWLTSWRLPSLQSTVCYRGMRMKPQVICLMASSVDGRTLPSRWRPKGSGGNLFEQVHDELAGDAWLVGRVTGQEFARGKPYTESTTEIFPREPWFARRGAK